MRNRVIYTGRVQGVGFRATTHSIASGFDVAGYVRNLPNGSVELVVEGNPREVQSLLDEIATRMHGYIEATDVADLARDETLNGFRIRH